MTELEAHKLRRHLDAGRAPPLAGRGALGARRSRNAWHELRKSRTASIGAVMLVLLFGACIATPWIATHDPIKQNYRERLQPPSREAPVWAPTAWAATSTRACCGAGGGW